MQPSFLPSKNPSTLHENSANRTIHSLAPIILEGQPCHRCRHDFFPLHRSIESDWCKQPRPHGLDRLRGHHGRSPWLGAVPPDDRPCRSLRCENIQTRSRSGQAQTKEPRRRRLCRLRRHHGPQRYRRRYHRHARPLACGDFDRCHAHREGCFCRKTHGPHAGRGSGHGSSRKRLRPHPPSRQHATLRPRIPQGRGDRS